MKNEKNDMTKEDLELLKALLLKEGIDYENMTKEDLELLNAITLDKLSDAKSDLKPIQDNLITLSHVLRDKDFRDCSKEDKELLDSLLDIIIPNTLKKIKGVEQKIDERSREVRQDMVNQKRAKPSLFQKDKDGYFMPMLFTDNELEKLRLSAESKNYDSLNEYMKVILLGKELDVDQEDLEIILRGIENAEQESGNNTGESSDSPNEAL